MKINLNSAKEIQLRFLVSFFCTAPDDFARVRLDDLVHDRIPHPLYHHARALEYFYRLTSDRKRLFVLRVFRFFHLGT